MSATYQTCSHIYDTGGICNAAAVKDQRYCVYHLRHRARLMRMAQYRARHQRFELKLPPLENMYAVQSALNQIFEAAATGMTELKQARFLLSTVRTAGQFLLRADKWQATPYHSDQPAAEVDLVAEYGLPQDLNLVLAPEVAFPQSVILSEERSDESKDPFVATDARGSQHSPAPPELPYSGNYCGDHHTRECECTRIRADHPVTPEIVEYLETSQTYGPDVAAARGKQLERNSERRRLNRDRKRYAAIALEHNLRRAAERMAELKLAERAKQDEVAAKKPPASVPADPQPKPQPTEKAVLSPTG